jgi:DNA-binding NtrC family response regulator
MIVVEWVAEDLGPKTERLWIERVKPDLLTNHSMVHRRSKLDRQLKQKLRNEAEDRIINQRLQSLLASPAEQPGSLTLLQTEYARILQVLRDCAGNKMEAARRLGIGRQTLYNKLRVIGLAQADVLAASPGNGSVGDGVSG